MFTRPKPGESEEDILAMQEAFFAEKKKNNEFTASAKVVNLRKHKCDAEAQSSSKQSKFAESRRLEGGPRVTFSENTTVINDDNGNCEKSENAEDKVYYPSVIPSLLGDIVEKNYDISSTEISKPVYTPGGFPAARKRFKPITPSSKSIFSQQMKKAHRMDVDLPSCTQVRNPVRENTSLGTHDRSVILQGSDATEIHAENAALLGQMTEKEILEEKEKLATMIDPVLLDYIKSLRKKNVQSTLCGGVSVENIEKTMPIIADTQPGPVDFDILKEIPDSDVTAHPNLRKWIHFDTFERDKLQWLKSIEPVPCKSSDQPYEARFNFKGLLLPYTLEYTEETKTLFHHGEEAHRPGYSLNELFQLCRSVVTQQRSLALNTLAGILEYHSVGAYNEVIDIPLTKIYFVLRFALDENISIILEPTLKGLRNMLYNRVDEACLDFLLGSENGLLQPRLLSTVTEKGDVDSDVSELKDFHLVDLDLVSGAIRTDLLIRISYVLSVVKPTPACVEYCLQILTRISRDSLENSERLFKTEGLLDCIFSNYVPTFIHTPNSNDTDHCKLILGALKLLRVAISQSKRNAELCVVKYNIFDSLLNYIGNVVVENAIILKIQVETFYVWSSLLHHGFGLNELTRVKGVLLKVLVNHVRGTDVSVSFPVVMHSHAGALITLLTAEMLTSSCYPDTTSDIKHLVITGIQKWSSQLCQQAAYTAGHLKSLSASLVHLTSLIQLNRENVKDDINLVNIFLKKKLESEGCDKILSNLIASSNLLSGISFSVKQSESNIPGLSGSLIRSSEYLLPTLSVVSPMCLVASLSKYISMCFDKDLQTQFIKNKYVFSYLERISSAKQLYLSDNWFTRIELEILCNIVHIVANLEFVDLEKETVYNFSFKLTYILSPQHKKELEFILKHIVFNKNSFSTERLLRNLNISETNDILNNLEVILECYISVLKLNGKGETFNLTVSDWNQKVLPRDWMFMPILGLYSKSQELDNCNIPKCLSAAKDDLIKHIVTCSLKWILVSELYFPEITNEIGLTDRFCRLSCIFLCDNSVFLDPSVKPLLQKCMRIIFDLENSLFAKNKLNFNNNLVGINSFQDFYTQMVDQFQAVSYGDPLFSACILVPLAQKHDVKWRKIVWSEYAACLRALDCPEEMLCYKIEEYLQPSELDFSLLKCYHRALTSNLVRIKTIAYRIAHTHVEYAKLRQRNKSSFKSTP